ncbi:glycosyltransferase [Parabacteroides sp. PF5-9]|uniref:glycosyltransferase n=1 Tax=Parabacteroides sp. PF5-9 TaxID=1742404 RepID=UPI002473FA82|nr:glycosyltransferase [Parabacteroides sp. PF5-9]MDH6357537.1 GT2 family glycosyltransferase [Parabacteroides sp. PF5-9]
MYETKLSILIFNYTSKPLLEQCLYAVQAATTGMDLELFIIDDHSSDEIKPFVTEHFPHITPDDNQINFTTTKEDAIRQSQGEYILLLNSNTIIGEESLRTLCFFMDEHPKIGLLGSKLIDIHGVFRPESKQRFPSWLTAFCKKTGLVHLFPQSRSELSHLNENKQHKVDVLPDTFLLIRHEAFDQTRRPEGELNYQEAHIEHCYRIMQAGYKNYYYPERILYFDPLSPPAKKKKKIKHRRLLILCEEDHFETIKAIAVKQMPELEYVNLWDLDVERVTDAICRRNQMKGFTDYVFCYPDARFEQMLLFMDKMVNKNSNYHFYNLKNKRFFSPEK